MSSIPHAIGCVSFLNSKPLIEPLLGRADVRIHFAVPSELLPLIDAGTVSTALLSLVDYQASRHDLVLVPAGAIGCDGPTLTVRIYSRIPPEEITTLHADTDSHTSLILAQLILRELYHTTPELVPLRNSALSTQHSALVLIGDKVINAAPPKDDYPYQLDLGEQWKRLTGLPFVFACWMMRADRIDQSLADLLAEAQREGARMTDALVAKYAAEKRWPPALARRYFTEYLRYTVTARAREGIERFFALAAEHRLLAITRRVRYLELTSVV